jgi:PPM family protein phosphatase
MTNSRRIHLDYKTENGVEINLNVHAITDQGLVSDHNDGNFLLFDLISGLSLFADDEQAEPAESIPVKVSAPLFRCLLAVADGFLGTPENIKVGRLTLQSIRDHILTFQAHDGGSIEFSEQIRLAIEHANMQVYNYSKEKYGHGCIFSALTVVGIEDDTAYFAQVGDTRAYLIRHDQLFQITDDQTILQVVNLNEYCVTRRVIIQSIGVMESVVVILGKLKLGYGDLLLLTSKGLTAQLEDDEMLKIILTAGDLKVACEKLMNTANEKGGYANFSAILCRVSGNLGTEHALNLIHLTKPNIFNCEGHKGKPHDSRCLR